MSGATTTRGTATTLGIRTKSEANQREHFAVKAKRVKAQREAARAGCAAHLARPALPCVVKLTRISPRPLDRDNLVGSCKAVIDGIADWLGIDDRDPRVHYMHEQQRGPANVYGVLVEITPSAVVVTEVRKVG